MLLIGNYLRESKFKEAEQRGSCLSASLKRLRLKKDQPAEVRPKKMSKCRLAKSTPRCQEDRFRLIGTLCIGPASRKKVGTREFLDPGESTLKSVVASDGASRRAAISSAGPLDAHWLNSSDTTNLHKPFENTIGHPTYNIQSQL